MNNRDQLIASLVDDLEAKKNRWPVLWVAALWWFFSWVYVVLMSAFLGSIRVIHQLEELSHAYQFQFETLLGLCASLLVAIVAWYASTPGALTKRYMYLGLFFIAAWLGFYVVGFFEPALEPSMHGKREHCYLEAFIYSLPPILVACFYIARRYPINKIHTGFLVGLAGGMMPALFMQLSCMYEPEHIFTHHILPAVFAGVIGIAVLLIVDSLKGKE